MSKWKKLKHRFQLATAYRWFLSLENDLKQMGMGNPSVIFDVGAHLGQTSLHFLKSFPGTSIHCFEPVDENFKQLKLNTKGKREIKINNVALGDSQKPVMMKTGKCDQTHQVSSNSQKTHIIGELPMIPMETIDSYVKSEGIGVIDILKIDVEGHELEVLEGAKHQIQKQNVKVILAECDFDPDDTQHTYFNDLCNYLRYRNFSFFGLYDVIHYGNNKGIGYCNALFIESTASGNGN